MKLSTKMPAPSSLTSSAPSVISRVPPTVIVPWFTSTPSSHDVFAGFLIVVAVIPDLDTTVLRTIASLIGLYVDRAVVGEDSSRDLGAGPCLDGHAPAVRQLRSPGKPQEVLHDYAGVFVVSLTSSAPSVISRLPPTVIVPWFTSTPGVTMSSSASSS
jgi:hypothetical protein